MSLLCALCGRRVADFLSNHLLDYHLDYWLQRNIDWHNFQMAKFRYEDSRRPVLKRHTSR